MSVRKSHGFVLYMMPCMCYFDNNLKVEVYCIVQLSESLNLKKLASGTSNNLYLQRARNRGKHHPTEGHTRE